MPPTVNWLVPKVHLNDNDSVVLVVEVAGFDSGNWAEISGYITQENGAYAPFSAIQKPSPAPVGGTPTVTVHVPPMGLVPGEDVKVITRVAEVQIWPTVLGAGVAEQNVKATWQAKDNNPAPASPAGQQGGLSAEVWPPTALTMQGTSSGALSDPTVTVEGLPPGTKFSFTVTVEAAAPQ